MPIEQPSPPGPRPSRSVTPWVPPAGGGTELVPAGVWWDAVRVRIGLGELVLERLGSEVGAVLRDPCDQRLYFLTRPQATVDWRFGCYATEVQALSTATWIAVPPRDRTHARGPHWLIPPDDGDRRLLTAPQTLHTAVLAALAEALGPRQEPSGQTPETTSGAHSASSGSEPPPGSPSAAPQPGYAPLRLTKAPDDTDDRQP